MTKGKQREYEKWQKMKFDDQRKRTKKSRIRETLNLSTDADSCTNAIGGWTKAKSAKKKNFFFCAAILDHFQTKMFKC